MAPPSARREPRNAHAARFAEHAKASLYLMAHKRHLHAAIAVIERNGRYLICQRHHHDSFGDLWEFPGGKREVGESWQACLRRELREEIGVTVRAVKAYDVMRHTFSDGTVFFRVFRCSIARGTPRPLDSQALRWVLASQLKHYQFPPANRQLITRLISEHCKKM